MSSASTKRACDACHRRKVRCNGSHPCHNCIQASLACTFNKPPQKKGPKGSRAKVISELRKTQEHDLAGPTSAPSAKDGFIFPDGSFGPPASLRTPGLLSPDLINTCVSYFFENLSDTMPILQRKRIQQTVLEMNASTEAYCLVSSLCAFMIIQPGMQAQKIGDSQWGPAMQKAGMQCLRIVEETVRVWNSYDHKDNPTLSDVLVAFFLSAAYFSLEKANAAWIHLREAITLAQLLGMHDEATYKPGDVDGHSRRRLFWLLFVSERGYSLHKHRPLTLYATIKCPTVGHDPSEAMAITGLVCLINLFRLIDDTFSRVWNTARSECSVDWLANLQKQLNEALPQELNCTETQEADIRMSQQWLRIIVWQMSTASGCLSSTSPDVFMSFTYPIEVSKEVVAISNRISRQALEIHGIGMIEKLFDITCTLIDVMSCVPIESGAFEIGPRDHLAHLLHLVSTLRGGESRYVPVLQRKIRDTLPAMATAFSLPIPPPALDRIMTNNADEGSHSSANSSPYSSPAQLHAPLRYPILSTNNLTSSITSIPPSMHTSTSRVVPGNPAYSISYGAGYST